MIQKFKHNIAVFFVLLFMAIISAPSIISSIDDSIDVSSFYGIDEEEESETLKILFDSNINLGETFEADKTSVHKIGYTFKTYPKPHLNLISPPPEYISHS